MRFVHISDLHFRKKTPQSMQQALIGDILSQCAELIAVTGDITDRGRTSQFKLARRFLDSLNIPIVSVPGNREVAATSFWEWLIPPLSMDRYSRFFGPSDKVIYVWPNEPIVFLGLNSVHTLPSWPGRITRDSRHWLKRKAQEFSGYKKILLLHHPVVPVIRSSSFWAHQLTHAGEILNICSEFSVNMILQGHKHRSITMEISIPQRMSKIVISAAGAPLMPFWDQSYHVIDISESITSVKSREFTDGGFHQKSSADFSSM
jgi:3',5'-cyclic AMP phosphodiesterase CpdA